jgi:hypothetical protein
MNTIVQTLTGLWTENQTNVNACAGQHRITDTPAIRAASGSVIPALERGKIAQL